MDQVENKWFPAHTHSYSSLLDSNSKPSDIVKRCLDLGYTACAVTDHGNISSSVEFHEECTKAGIKPVLGSEFYMSQQDANIQDKTNPNHAHLCVLAKNRAGWSNLVRATSCANKPEHFYYKPRLSLEQFAPFGKNLIAFSGHIGSEMANILFEEPKVAYRSNDAKSLLRPDWKKRGIELAGKYKEIFENFMLEVQLIDSDNILSTSVIGECIREISRATNIPCIATGDSHYCTKEDAADQRISLCTSFRTTLNKVYASIANDEDVTLSGFFKSNNYHIPSIEELLQHNTQEEIYNTYLLQEMCENYKLQDKPKIPRFSENDNYLITEKCRQALETIEYFSHKNEYIERMNYELSVITKYDLSGYFLIVQDYINWAREQGCLVGPGRGSVGGSLVSYLLKISMVDPLQYGLIFERFYNEGRNSGDHIELPDIDTDFPKGWREKVIEYIRGKYGNVYHIITFSRLKGRSAVKSVLSAHEACTPEEMNMITKYIPDEAKISDQLQVMKEAGEEPSIIRWALENERDNLKEWAYLTDDGVQGPFGKYFEQAMRIEGTKKSASKHASGIVISIDPIDDQVPIVYDPKNKESTVGFEMNDVAKCGILKLDILGLKTLNVLQGVQDILRNEIVG